MQVKRVTQVFGWINLGAALSGMLFLWLIKMPTGASAITLGLAILCLTIISLTVSVGYFLTRKTTSYLGQDRPRFTSKHAISVGWTLASALGFIIMVYLESKTPEYQALVSARIQAEKLADERLEEKVSFIGETKYLGKWIVTGYPHSASPRSNSGVYFLIAMDEHGKEHLVFFSTSECGGSSPSIKGKPGTKIGVYEQEIKAAGSADWRLGDASSVMYFAESCAMALR